MSGVLQNIDRYEVVFDDEGLVADAGLLAAGTLIVEAARKRGFWLCWSVCGS